MEEERTTVRLPRDLLRRAKRKAAADGRTLTSLIAAGLRMALADDRTPARETRPSAGKQDIRRVVTGHRRGGCALASGER